MMIRLETREHRSRFFDAFDEEARSFEDRLRGEPMLVESIPWPRLSFWQSYRHLRSVPRRFFVLQMARKDSPRTYQVAVMERASRLPLFKTGAIPYWIPSLEPEALREQAELLLTLRALCLEHTGLMSLRAHAYVPGAAALDCAEGLLREAGFEACAREAPEATRLIDLTPPLDEIRARFSKKIRALMELKKPEAVRVEALTSRARLPELQAALDDSFDRSTAEASNYDLAGLFDVIERSPEAAAAFGFALAEDGDRPKAFAAGVASPPLFEYTAAGSRSDARLRQFPFNYILLWRLIEAAKERGAKVFDMGGITPGGDGDPLAGISYFKRRFPGFETSVGRERLLELRPARCRAFEFLRTLLRRKSAPGTSRRRTASETIS